MKSYSYKTEWEEILPHGKSFCNWGGSEFSKKLIQLMSIESADIVIDLCCGYGGTLSLIKKGTLHGVDTDINAVDKNISNAKVICEDSTRTTYPENSFDIIFAQDPDVMLYGLEKDFFKEIKRIGKPGAKVFIQTYASSGDVNKLKEVLKELGYPNPSPVNIGKLWELSNNSFVSVKFISLHKMYYKSTNNFLLRASGKFKKLFTIEKNYFEKGNLTGILIVGKV